MEISTFRIRSLCLGCMVPRGSLALCRHCSWNRETTDVSPIYLKPGTLLNSRYLVGRVVVHEDTGVSYLAFDRKLNLRVVISEYLPREIATRLPGRTGVAVSESAYRHQFHRGLRQFIQETNMISDDVWRTVIISHRDLFEENGTAYKVFHCVENEFAL